MKTNQLTASKVRAARCPAGKRRELLQDGRGLMLEVTPSGRKRWIQRVAIAGKRRDLALGSAERVTLAQAREAAGRNFDIAREGGDPTSVEDTGTPKFRDGFAAVLALKRGAWKDGGKSEAQWRHTFKAYMRPLHAMPVDAIRTADVVAVLAPIWHGKHETARRVKQRIGEVMEWAAAHGYRDDNPADRAGRVLPKNGHHRQHFRALPYDRVSGALAAVEASKAHVGTKGAFRMLVLTAARSSEVRGMQWSEVDFEAATWTVPAGRMKAGREHRVPLSGAALEVLRGARERTGGEGLVFPAPRGGPLSDMTLSKLIKELGIEAVPHGFRSSFRQWAAEQSSAPREVAEAALAHTNKDKVEAAYQRSDLFERRRALMEEWAEYLERGHA